MRGRWLASTLAIAGAAVASAIGCGDDPAPASPASDAGADVDVPADAAADAAEPIDGVLLTYGTCADLTPCGGELAGERRIVGGCLSSAAFDGAKSGACSSLQERDVRIVAKGALVVEPAGLARDYTVTLSGQVLFPAECLDERQLRGQCELVRVFLTNEVNGPPLFDEASCAELDDGACDCRVTKIDRQQIVTTYAIDGGVVTTESDADAPRERSFGYCVAGDKLFFQEVAGSLPYVLELGE